MTAVTPLLMHWSHCSLVLNHWYVIVTLVQSSYKKHSKARLWVDVWSIISEFVSDQNWLFPSGVYWKPIVCDRGLQYLSRLHGSHNHDDVIKWKHFPHYWPFVRVIHRWPVNSPHKSQWRGALMFSLICAWTNNWEAGGLRCHRAHYGIIVMTDTL